MTLDGAVNKTVILLSLCFAGAFWNSPALTMPALIVGAILSFVTIFRSPTKTTAPFYAAFQGVAVFAEAQYGIGIQAIGLTFWNIGLIALLL